ncbi:alpha/beta hydrolase family protein [Pseudomonas sp. EpS/L25]|uniref:alpha/beta hydrolase family protein n=1 Tax=Pseudomonas sp. EpS/L25 TaxID=1749078 RepID=UPI00074418E2|nr:S9 family peptidase [Pseudomonas sp. EpS/L25]KUM39924.1 peptidase S9 [Pseudomonas sp. EpS/L25]
MTTPTPLTPAQAVAAGIDFAELKVDASGLYWSQYDPADGATRLWRRQVGSAPVCLTPAGFSLRSKVYEYGGGALCLADAGPVFVNEADQAVYRQPLDGRAPERLAGGESWRYGDLHWDALHGCVLAVEEDRREQPPRHRLVALGRAGERQVLAEGADFYAAPRTSADGSRLAWIEWDRPHQPWTRTRLLVAPLDAEGQPGTASVVSADPEEALQQPLFDGQHRLWALSDRQGWWQPWCETDHGFAAQEAPAADHAAAPWQLGGASWLPTAEGWLATWQEDGFGLLGERRADGQVQRLAMDFSRFRGLALDERHCYCIAAAPTRPPAVLAIERRTGAVEILCGGVAPLPETTVVAPRRLSYPSGDGQAQGFLYLPEDRGEGPPPLLVSIHGGPTSCTYPVFDARIQFWVRQGFAVADLNYRGSSGHGRAYRQALHLRWGEVDVEDACAAVEYLGRQGHADPQRAFIRGGSAGGYTALCALAFRDVFRAGASLYGVSDPLALAKVTHKFEADYLDWLIGDPEADRARYEARTPLLHADGIQAPVIFLQGLKDAVVVPAQTDAMAAALEARGVPVVVRRYPDEGHGFRHAANQADALEQEAAFYRRWL